MQTLHVISHTHWDREWYLTFQQFRLKLVHLIDGLLDILENDPDFKHFMLDGQTIVLDDYLHLRPEKEGVLRQHIENGRILIGPWHILPDMFLVSPEAHIRNLLQGARTARKFGPKMPVGYVPDPFGHPGQVPQILRGFGINVAALWRGVGDRPCEFWWQSPDGSKVLLAFLRNSYSNGASLSAHDPQQFSQQLVHMRDSLAAHSAANDYVIMFGTDHAEPSPQTSSAIAYADEHLPDTRVLHSTFPAYIQRISEQLSTFEHQLPTSGHSLPAVTGELRACNRSPLLPGVLSTRMWIKQRNRACETLLEKWAEPFSVFATLVTGDRELASERVRNPAPIIRQAWRLLMENHPHDSICGCSVDQVHDEMKPRFDQVKQIGEEITRQALQTLAQATDTQSEGALLSVLIFNPTGSPRSDLVEVEVNVPKDVSAFEIVDADGVVVPHETMGSSSQEIASIVLEKNSLRESIGAIHEGRVMGMAIVQVKVGRSNSSTATIEAILDEHGQPNIPAWQQAERDIDTLEANPSITHFHVRARTPRASRVCFVAPEIPAFGWRALWVRAVAAPAAAPPAPVNPLLKPLLPLGLRLAQSELGGKLLARLAPGDEGKPPFVIENEFFWVEASQMDGTLTITDKRTKAVYKGLNRFVDGGDAGDEYNYSPSVMDSVIEARLVSVKVFRQKLAACLEISCQLEIPACLSPDRSSRSAERVEIPIMSRVSLAPGIPRVDVHTEIENRAENHRLRVHFPAPFVVDQADYDGHFEVVRRPLGVPEKGADWVEAPRPEVPQRAFTDVSDGEIGLMIANRGLPEVEVLKRVPGTEIALTLLRCVGWLSRDDMPVRPGHAGPGYETPGGQVPGKWAFDYAIIPHAGNWTSAYRQAYAFEAPLRAMITGLHAGELPAKGAFVSHSPAEFVISALKETEDGRGWLVRGYNVTAEQIEVTLKPWRPFASAGRVDLAEEMIGALDLAKDGSVVLPVRGHEIVTVLFSA